MRLIGFRFHVNCDWFTPQITAQKAMLLAPLAWTPMVCFHSQLLFMAFNYFIIAHVQTEISVFEQKKY